MNKTRMRADSPEKGNLRYELFAEVINHYNKAMNNGYYLEAITLMESIICDRLESKLSYIKSEEIPFMTLGCLIQKLKSDADLQDLLNEIDQWRMDRNKALHEMAKIDNSNIKESFKEKYNGAQECAKKGIGLFRKIDKLIRH